MLSGLLCPVDFVREILASDARSHDMDLMDSDDDFESDKERSQNDFLLHSLLILL